MGKATIIEAQNSTTVFEEGKSSGILGKLKGIFADYKNGTRNSDRLYTEELWDNRVFGSEDVMEALETRTLFGELDHPEGDRCETLAKNAAITITKLEKRPEEGVIYGEAEILDTPTGRIVKALADSGAKLGISSRGMGEEVYCEGRNIIDPETYDFITFDVVVTPANTKARVSLTESKHLSVLTESLKKELAECETENQLNQMKVVLESINTTGKQELLDEVNAKLNSFNKVEVKSKLSEANKAIAMKVLKNKLNESNRQLEEAINASNQLADENAKLTNENSFLAESREALKAKIKESNAKCLELNAKLEESVAELNSVKVSLTEATTALENVKAQQLNESNNHKELMLRARQVNNKKYEGLKAVMEDETNKLNENLAIKDEEISKLTESNNNMKAELDNANKVLEENKQLKEQIKLLEAKALENNKKLTESKLQESNKIKALENRINALEQEKQKMEEAQDRFSKLSFNPIGTVKAIAENFNQGDFSQEDIELFNALTNK